MGQTFKQINQEKKVEKVVKKVGLSLGIIFSKEDIERFDIKYGSVITLDEAEIDTPKDI